MLNAIKNIKETFSINLDNKCNLDNAFLIPVLKPPNYHDIKFNVEALSFLLEEHPNMLMAILIAKEKFEQTLYAIETRNEIFNNKVKPGLDRINLKDVSAGDLEEALGKQTYTDCLCKTKIMVDLTETTYKYINEKSNELLKIARKLYPGKKFVRIP